jgi:hypothetical protein
VFARAAITKYQRLHVPGLFSWLADGYSPAMSSYGCPVHVLPWYLLISCLSLSPPPPSLYTGAWTQGPVLARQALYHLSHSTSPFCIGYFWDMVLLYAWTTILLLVLPWIVGMMDVHYCPSHWLRWSLMNFLPRLALIFTSWVAGITGLSHCALSLSLSLSLFWGKVSLCSRGWLWTHNPSASAS